MAKSNVTAADTSSVVDKSLVRSLIAKKQQQIKLFKEDKSKAEKDKSFKNEDYDTMISSLEKDIAELEDSL